MELNLREIEKKFLQDNLEDIGISRFSISSFSAYRENPFIWYLRYIAKHRSRWPMQGAWRNDAVKNAINRSIVTSEPVETLVTYAIELYHAKVVTHCLSIYNEVTPGYSLDDIVLMMRSFTKEKFPEVLKTIVDTQFSLNNGLDLNGKPLPAYLVPNSKEYESYLKKVQKQYGLIEPCVANGINYFRSVKEPDFAFHKRVQYSWEDLPRPVFEYSDIEFSHGYSIFIMDTIPKDLDDKKTKDHQLKCAFMSMASGKPWRLVYLSKPKPNDTKEKEIHEMFMQGMTPEQIAKEWKSPSGAGTTAKTVNKILAKVCEEGYVFRGPVMVFDLPQDKIPKLNLKNKVSGMSISKMISKCDPNHLDEDLKWFCLGSFEHMFLDPDQKEAIEKIWGFEAEVESEDEPTSGEEDEAN